MLLEKLTKIEIKKLLFLLSAVVFLTLRFWGINMNLYVKYIIAGIWCFFLVIILIKDNGFRAKNIRRQFFLMVFPLLFMSAYAIILWVLKSNNLINHVPRLASEVLYMCLTWGFASIGYYYFGKKSIDYLFYAGCISYFFGSVLCLVVKYGANGIVLYVKSLILGVDSTANYIMEVHDLTFAMGLFFLYYLFFEDKNTKHHYKKVIVSALLIFLGLKRIEVLALIIAILIYFVLLKWGKKITFRAIVLTIVFLVISLGFIYIIYSGILDQLVNLYNIDTKGRLDYYGYAKRYFEMKPTFPGLGFTYFSKLFGDLSTSGLRINGYRVAHGIHSNMLVQYIENGFVVFCLWIIYSFYTKTKKLYKKCSMVSAECYLLLTSFVFILYLTDNCFKYPNTQMMYFIIPLVLAESPYSIFMKISKKNKKREKDNEEPVSM